MLQALFRNNGFLVREQVNPYKGNLQKISTGSPKEISEEEEVKEKEMFMSSEEIDFVRTS